MNKPRTMYDKIWDDHVVDTQPDGTCLLYIDRHLVHEVTSPQAFEGLRIAGRSVRCPERTFATMDHNVPTDENRMNITDPIAKAQMDALTENATAAGVSLFPLGDDRQGVVHIIGPELGI